jgi:cytidyltransferase-like protein
MINKIAVPLTVETLYFLSRDLRVQGKVVGFTHGTFDLFHAGHLFLLTEAAKLCDFLVVALESDKNVKAYKNIGRPVISQENRLNIVNNLMLVGNAFINSFDPVAETYDYYYEEIHPDIVFYGRGFSFEDNLLSQTSRLGIKVHKVENDIESTSGIIQRIRKNKK